MTPWFVEEFHYNHPNSGAGLASESLLTGFITTRQHKWHLSTLREMIELQNRARVLTINATRVDKICKNVPLHIVRPWPMFFNFSKFRQF